MLRGGHLLTFFAALGGLLFGYDTGIISGSILYIRQEFALSPLQESWVVSVTVVGAMAGAILSGALNDHLGRRPTTLLSSVVFVLGAALMAWARHVSVLVLGRFVVGVAIGIASMTSPLYISEVAPAERRGQYVSYNVFAITGGQCVAYFCALALADVPDGWRWMLGASALPAILQFLGMLVMPESPRYLLARGRAIEARAASDYFDLHHTDAVPTESATAASISSLDCAALGVDTTDTASSVEECRLTIVDSAPDSTQVFAGSHQQQQSLLQSLTVIWTTPALRRALIIAVGLLSFQQLCGVNVAMYYSARIIQMAGVESNSQAILLSSAVALANAAATLLAMYLIDRVGRRPLLLVTIMGLVVSLLGLAVGFGMAADGTHEQDGQIGALNGPDSTPASAIIAVLSLTLYVLFMGSGMGCVPWTIMSEVFPSASSGVGGSIATAANWACNFLVSLTFLPLTAAISIAGTFYLYAGMSVLAWVFVWQLVPETRGRTVAEIQRLLAGEASGNSGSTGQTIIGGVGKPVRQSAAYQRLNDDFEGDGGAAVLSASNDTITSH